jgi:alpha-galactosidase
VGTGASLIGDRDSSRGLVDVFVDETLVQRIDAFASGPLATQQRLFGVRGLAQGVHSIKGCKVGGTFMDIDRVDVLATTVVNDDAGVSYAGSAWVDSNRRGLGDFNDDVHFTTQNGDSAAFAFTGTGVDFITETNADRGVVDVRVDGLSRARIFTYHPTLDVQQTVYRLHGLARGAHRLVLTKQSGTFMAVDAFMVFD